MDNNSNYSIYFLVFSGEIPYTGGEDIPSLDLCDHFCIGRDTLYRYTFYCCLEMFKGKEE